MRLRPRLSLPSQHLIEVAIGSTEVRRNAVIEWLARFERKNEIIDLWIHWIRVVAWLVYAAYGVQGGLATSVLLNNNTKRLIDNTPTDATKASR